VFGLERLQQRHNATKSTVANISASNDPHQVRNDVMTNEGLLIQGAGVIARQRARQKIEEGGATAEQAQRAMDEVGPAELKGVSFSDTSEERVGQGMGQDSLQNYSKDELAKNPQLIAEARDPNLVRFFERNPSTRESEETIVSLDPNRPTPGLKGYYQEQANNLARIRRGQVPVETNFPVIEELLARDAGIYWESEGKSESASSSFKKPGIFGGKKAPKKKKYRQGYYTTRGGAGGRDIRTESQRFEDNRDAIAAEKQLSADMVAAESARRNPEAEEANLWRAQAEARILAKENAGAGSETLRTGQWQQPAGGWSGEYPIAVQGSDGTWIDAKSQMSLAAESPEGTVNLGSQSGPADRATTVGTYVDPMTGAIMPVQEPATTSISGANTPNTGQMLNAPASGSAIDWVASQVPDIDRSGSGYADKIISTDLGATAQIFSERIGRSPDSAPIRNIVELQEAADRYIASRQAAGGGFSRRDEAGVHRKIQGTPTFDDVLSQLKYTTAEKRALASSMFTREMASRSGVNQAAKDSFYGAGRTNPAAQIGRGNWADDDPRFPRPMIINDAGQAMLSQRDPGFTGTQPVSISGKVEGRAVAPYFAVMGGDAGDWATGNTGAKVSWNKTGETDRRAIAQALIAQERQRYGDVKPVRRSQLQNNIINAIEIEDRAHAADTARDAAAMASRTAPRGTRPLYDDPEKQALLEGVEAAPSIKSSDSSDRGPYTDEPNQKIVSSRDRSETERQEGRMAEERRRRMGRPSIAPGSIG